MTRFLRLNDAAPRAWAAAGTLLGAQRRLGCGVSPSFPLTRETRNLVSMHTRVHFIRTSRACNNRVTARIPSRRVRASDHLSKKEERRRGRERGRRYADARRRDIAARSPVTWTCVGLHILRFPGSSFFTSESPTSARCRSSAVCTRRIYATTTTATHGALRENIRITRSCLAHWPTASLVRSRPSPTPHSENRESRPVTSTAERSPRALLRDDCNAPRAPRRTAPSLLRTTATCVRRAIDAPGADRMGPICAATLTMCQPHGHPFDFFQWG